MNACAELSSESVETTASAASNSSSIEQRRAAVVFLVWCLRRETNEFWPYTVLLMPLICAGFLSEMRLSLPHSGQQGSALFAELVAIGSLFVCVGGIRHASTAVTHEASREMRDLVRLTGLDPRVLLWCKSLSRWLTIVLSIVLLLPLAMYARTLGGVTDDQWISAAFCLLMVAVLIAGLAMMSTVSPSDAKRVEYNAASVTAVLLFVYHMIFVLPGAVLWFSARYNQWGPSVTNLLDGGAEAIMSMAPIVVIYRANANPYLFSPLAPRFWMHLIVGLCCMWMSLIVIRNRFRVTTRGDDPIGPPSVTAPGPLSVPANRPRCGDRPFFWKDCYILGGGVMYREMWKLFSFLGLMCVIGLWMYSASLVAAICALIAGGSLLAFQFDAMMAVEFRDQTWSSLMLLPVNPIELVRQKAAAAASQVRWLLLPVCVANAIAFPRNHEVLVMAWPIAIIATVLLLVISALNHLSTKSWWAGSVIGCSILCLIFVDLSLWLLLPVLTSFALTVIMLLTMVAIFYGWLGRRLATWTDA